MTPEEARRMYAEQFDLHGLPIEDFAIRRYAGIGATRTHLDRPCRARGRGYVASELSGAITQGDRMIVVLAEDLEGESPPFTITKSDKAIVNGAELSIMSVDDLKRRIGATLIAYELQARG